MLRFKFLTKECSCIDHGTTCYIIGVAATQGKTLQVAVYGLELRVKSEIGKHAMSSSAARKARIGEVPQAEGFGKH